MNNLIPLLAESALKGTVLLAAATTLVFAWRRASAARRYAVWFSALAGLLVLPFLSPLIPGFKVLPAAPGLDRETSAAPSPRLTAEPAAAEERNPEAAAGLPPRDERPRSDGSAAAATESSGAIPPFGGTAERSPSVESGSVALSAGEDISTGFTREAGLRVLFWIWLAGALVVASPLLFGWLGIRRLTLRAKPVVEGREAERVKELTRVMRLRRPVRLLWGPWGAMPMTWGFGLFGPPAILLPAEANRWSPQRLDAVLLHELAHVRRRDCLTQFLSRCARAVYWFHPWVWIAAGRLLVERERACDDEVLRHTPSPAAYARDLVDVAGGADASLPAARAAIAMARPHKLDGRLRAILDTGRNRTALTRKTLAALLLFTALVVLPVASLQWAEGGERTEVSLADESENASLSPANEEVEQRTLIIDVVDTRTGAPLPHADLRISRPERLPLTQSDEPGHWEIVLPRADLAVLSFRVEADGFVPKTLLWQNESLEDRIPEGYTVALEPGTWVGGRIVDDEGAPVAEATVFLDIVKETNRPNERVDTRFVTLQTGEDGHWEYPSAPAEFDRIGIGAHHPDYASHRPGQGWIPMQGYERSDGYRDGSLNQILSRGISLEGVVLDASGEPAEGASIGIGPDRVASNAVPERIADSEGRFRLGVHPGESLVLTVKHPGHAPELLRLLQEDLDSEIRIQLSSGHTLRGRIVDSAGDPIEGAWAFVDTWRDVRTLTTRLFSDSDGYFEWHEAPEDEVSVDVLANGYVANRDISIGTERANRIELARPTLVRFRVVDAASGEPVERFTAVTEWVPDNAPELTHELERREIENDAGRFEWLFTHHRHYREGCTLRIEAEGYEFLESSVLSIIDGGEEFTFELEQQNWPSGRVVDASGEPAEEANIYIATAGFDLRFLNGKRIGSGRQSSVYEQRSDRDGTFRFPPPDVPYRVVVLHEWGFAEMTEEEFTEDSEIVLQPWARIEGKASIRDMPAAGAEISTRYLRDPGNGRPHISYEWRTSADDNGAFVFDRVPPRDVLVSRMLRDQRVRYSGFRPVYQNVSLVRLEPGREASIAIGGNGRPVVGRISVDEWNQTTWFMSYATITGDIPAIRDPGMTLIQKAKSDLIVQGDGTFRIEDLEPGAYLLRIGLDRETRSSGSIARYSHRFTVPEFEGPYSDEPLELPVLQPE